MCTFAAEDLEDGIISRVQKYEPAYIVCNLKYTGKVTIKESGERYLAFVTPATKIYNKNGIEIPVERLKVGQVCEYLFQERIDKPQKPSRITGLLAKLWVKGEDETP